MRRLGKLWGLIGILAACKPTTPEPPKKTTTSEPASTSPSLNGRWRAQLDSPGGPLPFIIHVADGKATIENDTERAPISAVVIKGRKVTFDISWYDAQIDAERAEAGNVLTGTYRKTIPNGVAKLPFSAQAGDAPRFTPKAAPSGDVTGVWRVTFTDEDGTYPARGVFTQRGAIVTGTFLTETGDYRYLEGVLDGPLLKLSCFDGAHAFLFTARLDGERLTGDFWSRDHYHATWTGQRVASEQDAPLSDPYGLASITNPEGRLRFSFEDVDGQTVSSEDPKFRGRVLIVDIFGTWCPNCNDQAPLLAQWAREYKDRGLEIVGLAYEFSGDPDRDRTMLRRYAERHGITFPLLLAGVSNKKKAGATLPDLSKVVAYPTTIFVGRDGKVRTVHTGFSGPGTGEAHRQEVDRLEKRLLALLAEPAAQ